MKKTSLLLIFAMMLSFVNLTVVVYAENLFSQNFDEALSTDEKVIKFTAGSNFTVVERPADNIAVNTTAAEPLQGRDRALLSGKVQNGKASMYIPTDLSGELVFETDFRLEGKPTTGSGVGEVKFYELYGKTNLSPTSNKILFSLTMGATEADSFKLRLLYHDGTANQTTSLNTIVLDYKKWYKMSLKLNTENAEIAVSIDGTEVVTGYCYNPDNATVISKVNSFDRIDAYHTKEEHAASFLIDNILIKQDVPASVEDVQALSSVYNVNQDTKTISGIQPSTTVSAFLANITYSKTGAASVVRNSSNAIKSAGNIETGDKLDINGGEAVYSLNVVSSGSLFTFNNFNDGILPPNGWGGFSTPYFSAPDKPKGAASDPVPSPDDKAVYVNGVDNNLRRATYSLNYSGDIEFTADFYIPTGSTNSSINQIKLCEITGKKGEVSNPAVNVNFTSNLRLTYSNGTNYAASVSASGSEALIGKWFRLKVIANTATDKVSVWYNDTPFVENYDFQGVSASNVAPWEIDEFAVLNIYNNASATNIATHGTPPSFYFDNVMLRPLASGVAVTSDRYAVSENTVGSVLVETTVADFKSRISLSNGATAAVYSTYDVINPVNNVLRTGIIQDGDKLVVTAENLRTKNVYTINTTRNVVVSIIDENGIKVTNAASAAGNMVSLKADIINDGFNDNKTDFVLILVSYSGEKMVLAEYEKVSVPISGAKVTKLLKDVLIPNVPNLKLSAFVWNGFSDITPLAIPDDIH